MLNLITLLVFTEKDIETFMSFYRATFPDATVLQKMHILEEHHTIPWLQWWHLGSGLMGEQEAESIHAHMMRLERTYQGVVDKLNYIVKEHLIESAPSLTGLRPQPKRRKNGNQRSITSTLAVFIL